MVPIPEDALLDLLIIIELTLFLIFCFAFGFNLFNVATNLAPVLAAVDRFTTLRVPPAPKTNWSALKGSILPSPNMSEYLSSSNPKNDSLDPAETALEKVFEAMVTS